MIPKPASMSLIKRPRLNKSSCKLANKKPRSVNCGVFYWQAPAQMYAGTAGLAQSTCENDPTIRRKSRPSPTVCKARTPELLEHGKPSILNQKIIIEPSIKIFKIRCLIVSKLQKCLHDLIPAFAACQINTFK